MDARDSACLFKWVHSRIILLRPLTPWLRPLTQSKTIVHIAINSATEIRIITDSCFLNRDSGGTSVSHETWHHIEGVLKLPVFTLWRELQLLSHCCIVTSLLCSPRTSTNLTKKIMTFVIVVYILISALTTGGSGSSQIANTWCHSSSRISFRGIFQHKG